MSQAPYTISYMNGPRSNTFELKGALVIIHIENIYGAILSKLDVSKNVEMFITEVTSIDITFLQLIISLKKTLIAQGNEFSLTHQLSEDHMLLLKNAGFDNQL
jgi:hypothetical protein